LKIAAADKDEFVVEAIVGHRGTLTKRSSLEFRVRWQGYDESEDTWLPLREVKDLVALDQYITLNPELMNL
jgi:Chromo (CHRromatin Organisation MOdifier) domain